MRERLDQLIDRLTVAWDGLNERERIMVGALGAVLAVFVLFVAAFLFSSTLSERREELDGLHATLTEIELAAADYGAREGERRASELRLDREVPSLKGHLEEVAEASGTPITSFGSEKRTPARGKKYDEVSVEVKFRRLPLDKLSDFMQRLEADRRYAFAIKRLNLRVDFSDKDLLNAKVEVVTYARIGGPAPDAKAAPGKGDVSGDTSRSDEEKAVRAKRAGSAGPDKVLPGGSSARPVRPPVERPGARPPPGVRRPRPVEGKEGP